MIEGVIFDLDGVMIDSEPLALEAWQRCLAPYGLRLSDEHYRILIGTSHESSVRFVVEQFGGNLTHDKVDRAFWAHMLALVELAKPMPGLFPLLEELRRRGYALGIASNSKVEYVHKAIHQTGLHIYFQCVASAEEVTQGKPAPDVYVLAAQRLGLPAANCVAVEDSPSGVQAALAAGMRCVLIPNPDLRDADQGSADAAYPTLREWHEDLNRLLPARVERNGSGTQLDAGGEV